MPTTLYDKLWDSHVIAQGECGECLLYIDRHLINEVTSPQAFDGLREAKRQPWSRGSIIATADHNTPTSHWERGIEDPMAREQVEVLDQNIRESGALAYFPFKGADQGIVHVVGPELGATQPGMTIVCGDSHTSTHGAFAALAFGIGTSDVEHVLATQTLVMQKSKNLAVVINGDLHDGVYAKDLALAIICQIGTAGATGYAIEFMGKTISQLSMEGRMTLCNMAIEAGARTGLVAVDDVTVDYLKGRRFSPPTEQWETAVEYWQTLRSDDSAHFDRTVHIDAKHIKPMVTWGTSPEMVVGIQGKVPNPAQEQDLVKRSGLERALRYMALTPGTPMRDIKIDKVFIGSCTNARIEDLRIVAKLVEGKQVASSITQALIVPGSGAVRRQAQAEGLDLIFTAAGFEWREPGCSMCLGMNDDRLSPGERCASTSNRNFEGRQGMGGRSHLMSPAMAAAAALSGYLTDITEASQ
ncbi:3-isopropylmalate dehydratase large subunit [Pseudomonas poae]|uniref:3-isopropylmalate dehydratase large subunit n=1 Tax=Pseudomonas poae TaxID=200451 RepID=A0A423FAS7_9PSED|nr:3-isopropylmalate dehydratase large subunit [Pseudomonas poae]ROM53409.1 3-isopropylmalate dehydratase large subunit [Pseudomonas poae]